MNLESLLATLLILGTCGVALVFGLRQFRQIQRIDGTDVNEEKAALRASARRRLCVSLLLALAGLTMAATFVTGLAGSIEAITQRRDGGDFSALTPDEVRDTRIYGGLWIGVLLLVGAAVILIGYDMLLVRRAWQKSWQRLRDDRRAMLERQLARLRAEKVERNGYHAPGDD